MNDMKSVQDMVMLAGDQVMTDSRKVAQHFGKLHKDVLRAYDRLECSQEFNGRNFAPVTFMDAKGEIRRAVQMTKDGFMFLVMGFTGQKAAAIKEAFIEAFNRMAEFIHSQAMGAWERFNAAWLEYRHDRDHVSHCATDMNHWKRRKPVHLDRLERLNPQMRLPLAA